MLWLALWRVLDVDGLGAAGVELLRKNDVEVVTQYDYAECDAVVVRSKTRVSESEIAEAARGRLRLIGRAGVGLDNIDVEACQRHGVTVLNTPGASSNAVAELTIAHLLATARDTLAADRATRAGDFASFKKTARGKELRGSSLGLVGAGRIARCVRDKAETLGMRVRVADSTTPLQPLFADCDFVSVHCSYVKDLIGIELLSLMSQGRLVNMARGGVVNEDDVLQALDQGHLARYAADVFDDEPSVDPRLFRPDVILSPHIGAATSDAQTNVATDLATQLLAFLNGDCS